MSERKDEFTEGTNKGLTDLHKAMLDFEDEWTSKYGKTQMGPKSDQIMKRFGQRSTRYHQQIISLIDNPAALEYKPQLINRLARLRETSRRARSINSLPPEKRP